MTENPINSFAALGDPDTTLRTAHVSGDNALLVSDCPAGVLLSEGLLSGTPTFRAKVGHTLFLVSDIGSSPYKDWTITPVTTGLDATADDNYAIGTPVYLEWTADQQQAIIDLLPTSDQHDALAGTDGTPGSGNPYVTDSDARNSDDRNPTAHGNSVHTTTGTPGSSAVGDSAAQGSSASVARLDHQHGREAFDTPTDLGNANAAGSATTVPHSDHVHKRTVRVKKAGSDIGTRNAINLIEGSNVTLTVTDNSGSDQVDITIDATGGGTGLTQAQVLVRASLRG